MKNTCEKKIFNLRRSINLTVTGIDKITKMTPFDDT